MYSRRRHHTMATTAAPGSGGRGGTGLREALIRAGPVAQLSRSPTSSARAAAGQARRSGSESQAAIWKPDPPRRTADIWRAEHLPSLELLAVVHALKMLRPYLLRGSSTSPSSCHRAVTPEP